VSAIEQLITNNIDVWSSAIQKKKSVGRGSSKKIELYGIKKLRELILELAVRGLLVSQDPNDEPASALLEKLKNIKAELINNKLIKKNRKLPVISDDEKSFHLPSGWAWERFDEIYDVRDGTHDSPKPQATGYPLVTSKNLYTGQLDMSNVKYISETDHLKIIERSYVERNDILFAMIGSIGNPVIVDVDEPFSIKNVALFKYFDKSLSVPSYLRYYLKLAAEIMKGQSSGGVQAFVSLGNLRSFVMGVPPLAEQHRIVAKVDELMALCDQLEQQQENSIAAHELLVETLLTALTNAANKGDFDNAWTKIANHFDTLFTTEHSIDQLKQTILQLAVMGKLVPQDLSDEPASLLLEKITVKKELLVKEKKIKKQKELPEITEDEKPFELPKNWLWVRLGYITSKITDGDHQTPPRIAEGYRLLSAKNVRDGYLEFKNCDFISEEHYIKSRERCLPEPGDLLIVSVGGTIGRTSLVPADSDFALVRSVALIKPLLLNSSYLKHAMDSSLLQNSIHSRKRGGAQPCLYLSEIEMFGFSLPPIEEQERIVVKVDELLALCDSLKQSINTSKITQLHLADVMADQALI